MHRSPQQNAQKNPVPSDYAAQIRARLEQDKLVLQTEFSIRGRIQTFFLDDLLSDRDAQEIYAAFPAEQQMRELKSLREHKYVAMQLDQFNPKIEAIIYAFQAPNVVALISEITGLQSLFPDEQLYAGGISVMGQGNYLNPHLDNSHDKAQNHYRALNLLYYISPNWQPEFGGNLELWDNGLTHPCRTIDYKFNRLVVMITNRTSWHSVSPICQRDRRCCVSNYYFSPESPSEVDYAHVTSFRGRPDQPLRNLVLQGDAFLRNCLPEGLKKRIRKPDHYYQKQS